MENTCTYLEVDTFVMKEKQLSFFKKMYYYKTQSEMIFVFKIFVRWLAIQVWWPFSECVK